jgi:hypothetical protein
VVVAALLASLAGGGARCCGMAFPNGTAFDPDDVPVVEQCVKRHPLVEKTKMQCLRSRNELQTPAVPGSAQLPCSHVQFGLVHELSSHILLHAFCGFGASLLLSCRYSRLT